jgi:hypothetical protein
MLPNALSKDAQSIPRALSKSSKLTHDARKGGVICSPPPKPFFRISHNGCEASCGNSGAADFNRTRFRLFRMPPSNKEPVTHQDPTMPQSH